MSDRAIYCGNCKTPLGVIRDARLKKGITYLCAGCSIKSVSAPPPPGFETLFGMLNKKTR